MNCVKDDIARIIDSPLRAENKKYVGKWVRCISTCGDGWWDFEPLSHGLPDPDIYQVEDQYLRPIRPGESPEQSIEAMRLLTEIPKETV